VTWKGRLLFMDGWQYSSTDYRGPEYPPPTDEYQLRHLKRMYWTQRRFAVKFTVNDVAARLEAIELQQEGRDQPLQQTTRYYDDDMRKWVTIKGPVDTTLLKARLQFLRQDLVVCDQMLEELSDGLQRDQQPDTNGQRAAHEGVR
jgi:hypothetical protein